MKILYKVSLSIIFFIILTTLLLVYSFAMAIGLPTIMASFSVLTFALFVTLYYFFMDKIDWVPKENIAEDEEIKNWENEKLTKIYELQYREISAGIRSRDNMTVVAGSIMITASLILLASLAQMQFTQEVDFVTKGLMIAAIMAMYSVWFVCFELTTARLNALQYSRLCEMEEARKFKHHQFMREQVWDKNMTWFRYARRPVWLYFFYILTVTSLLILLLI